MDTNLLRNIKHINHKNRILSRLLFFVILCMLSVAAARALWHNHTTQTHSLQLMHRLSQFGLISIENARGAIGAHDSVGQSVGLARREVLTLRILHKAEEEQ